MNCVQLVGRLTRDPDVKYDEYDGDKVVARFTVAVDRPSKAKKADFPSCVAFGHVASFIDQYFHKGMRIGIVGKIQTGSYEKADGTKVYTTDVVVDRAEFVESKQAPVTQQADSIPAGYEEFDPDIPF